MNNSGHLMVTGTVVESNKGIFKVQLDEKDGGAVITARPCGKMRQAKINVVVHDRVSVIVSPYDLNNGLIKFRL